MLAVHVLVNYTWPFVIPVLHSQTATDYEITIPEQHDVSNYVHEDIDQPPGDVRWEILWSNLVVDDHILGRGNFGEVRSGTVNIGGQRIKSAIKMLKGMAY